MTIDTTPPVATIQLDDAVTSDNIINAQESGEAITISGSVGGDVRAGDTVTLTVNGVQSQGVVESVEGALRFSAEVQGSDLVADGDLTIDAAITTTDDAGNISEVATDVQTYTVDLEAFATITVEVLPELEGVALENAIAVAAYRGDTLNITGVAGQDAADGGEITLTVNGNVYTGTVDEEGTYSIAVAAADLVDAESAEGTTRAISVTVEASDEAGNPATASAETDVLVRPVQQVQFTDNFVDGVSYTTTSGLSGTTGTNESTGEASAQGSFLYRAGDTITLTLGSVIIAEFSADQVQGDVLFLQDIAGVALSDVNNEYVENMAIFLQALDADANPDNGIQITPETAAFFEGYTDAGTGEALNLATAGKQMLANALSAADEFTPEGFVFTAISETDPVQEDGSQNVFETEALDHVAETIEDLSGGRDPEVFDERTPDTIDVPGGIIDYNFNFDAGENGEITFTRDDLLVGAVPQQVTYDNLEVSEVALSEGFTEIGELTFDEATGVYTIALNEGITRADVSGLTVDYQVRDWTAVVDAVATTLDESALTAVDDTAQGDEDTAILGSVADNDTTTSGGTLSYAVNTDLFVAENEDGSFTLSQGVLTLDPEFSQNGQYSFQPNENYNGTDSFSYTVTDSESGERAVQTVTITVDAVNDAPVITSAAQTGAVVEETTLTASGAVTSSDVDTTATASYTTTDTATYGTFTLNADGTWDYALDNTNGSVQALNAGEPLTETFTVTVTDDNGALATQDVVVTITGADDVATIDGSTVATGSVTEDDATTANGDIDATDIDTNDAPLVYTLNTTEGTYGDIEINKDTGAWTYTIDNTEAATQALNNGQTETDSFTVTVTNADNETITQTISVSVLGTDDVATIDGTTTVATGSVTEDDATTANGDIDATDIDTNDAPLVYTLNTTEGTYGDIEINKDTGAWTYTIDNTEAATQALNNGQTETDSFTVTVTNADNETITQTISVSVLGTDDVATIDGTTTVATGSVTEDDATTANGDIDATDIDTNDAPLVYTLNTTEGTYGDIEINKDTGAWTYTIDNTEAATQALNNGQTETDSFTVTVTNADNETITQTISVSVLGTDDVATIDGTTTVATGSVTEDDATTANGDIDATDIDTNDAPLVYTLNTTEGTYGDIEINKDTGAWTYTIDNTEAATQALNNGQTETDSFTVTVTNADNETITQTISVSVLGTDDVATIDGTTTVATGSVTEDDATTANGDIDATDIDTNDAPLVYTLNTTEGTYGDIEINKDTGAWTYTIDNTEAATQALNNGQTETDSFTVTVTNADNETITQTISVSVLGTDDVATIDGTTTVATGSVTEDDATTANGDIDATDIDTNDAPLVYTLNTTEGTYGDIEINKDTGAWTYTIDNTEAATQALNNGQTETDSFTVTVTNADNETITQTISVSVLGTDDVATIDGTTTVATGSVTEDDATTANGDIDATDIDTNDAPLVYTLNTTEGTYGDIEINKDTGAWTYTIDNTEAATQALNNGQTETDSFTVTVTNADNETITQTISVSVLGTDDVATIDGTTTVATGSVTEDDATTANGDIDATDIDTNDAPLVYTLNTTEGTYGDIEINKDTGAWTYTIDNTEAATQALNNGQTETDSFTVTVTNADNETITQTISVSVLGTDDVATIDGTTTVATGSVTEDDATTANGDIDATDIDTNDAPLVYTLNTTEGTYGDIEINKDTGAWTYTIDNTEAATQALNNGQTETDSFTVTVTNADNETITQTISVSVLGTDDVATIDGTTTVATGSVTEDDATTANGDIDATDIDTNDAPLVYHAEYDRRHLR